ncbi:glycosyltransferase [Paraburkholderia kururiensis]|uniref:Glycosyltransferase n=1 Tax=Paraburkholderia kururiensis TaxID=984307 RepID=A0ABZ0WHU8_9BURK|nr:glycosyltransferase [Paraburkholderia kururiensis]WQD76885.1 glycosyltransferase [Paraburkholderia kururiensis]
MSFGLPVLEALACGAPTIASNTSSLPEVVGLDEALFDPRSAQDLANKMLHALADVEFAAKLRRNGLAQARRFSWQRSATLALEAIERTFRPRDYSPINYKDEHGFVDAVLAALSAHQPRVTPMRQDIDLLRDSAKKAWAELRRLEGGPVR